ncbi:SMI1/KNR4 family protein [Kitasatospora sp. NPDC059327]|uniref:SMI1/KNR4 family protein n=1 Tax=Kitasatospora sp. NPDC059327 TaxID=3346803 RepID=UPI0036CF415D
MTDHASSDELALLRAAFTAGPADGPAAGPAGPVAGRSEPARRTPPLGWDAVRAFEAEHGIVLPEPYRTVVAEICDGCSDGPPYYGLIPVAALPADWGAGRPPRVLAEPFPLTAAWQWEDDPRPEEEVDALLERVFQHGSIVLGTDGCGMYWHLVVSGPGRGEVWLITGEGAVPHGTADGGSAGEPGFAGWVGRWAAGLPWWSE